MNGADGNGNAAASSAPAENRPEKRARKAVITQAVNALLGEHKASEEHKDSQRQRSKRGRKKDDISSQKKKSARGRSAIKERTLNRLVLLAKDNNDQ